MLAASLAQGWKWNLMVRHHTDLTLLKRQKSSQKNQFVSQSEVSSTGNAGAVQEKKNKKPTKLAVSREKRAMDEFQ